MNQNNLALTHTEVLSVLKPIYLFETKTKIGTLSHHHRYFLNKHHQMLADSPGPIRHAGIPFMSTVFLSYQKCERADVFTKFIRADSVTAPKVNYAAQMLIIR
jgi:hypothetical protein